MKGQSHRCISDWGYIKITRLLISVTLWLPNHYFSFISSLLHMLIHSLSYNYKLISLPFEPTCFLPSVLSSSLIYLLTPFLIHSLDPLPHSLFLFISPVMYGLLGLPEAFKPSPRSFNVLQHLSIKNSNLIYHFFNILCLKVCFHWWNPDLVNFPLFIRNIFLY